MKKKSSKRLLGFFIGILFFCISIGITDLHSQTSEEELLFSIFGDDLSEVDSELIQDILTDFAQIRENPIKINQASRSQLLKLPLIDPSLAKTIIHERKKRVFIDINDLRHRLQLTQKNSELLAEFLSFRFQKTKRKPPLFSQVELNYTQIFRYEVEREQGYKKDPSTGGYFGSPLYQQNRILITIDNIEAGITQEKDAGEQGKLYGSMDYNNTFVYAPNLAKRISVAIGNYDLTIGQGLWMWTKYGSFKGQNVWTAPQSRPQGLTPNRSSREYNLLRGIALKGQITSFLELLFFYSNKAFDASIIDNTSTRLESYSGLHRTHGEIENKNSNRQFTTGLYLQWIYKQHQIGIGVYSSIFKKSILQGDQLHQNYDFEGRKSVAFSITHQNNFQKLNWVGEWAIDHQKGWAIIQKISLIPNSDIRWIAAFRYYDPSYHALYSRSFGEQSNTKNELGAYIGIRTYPLKKIETGAFIDYYHFPASRFNIDKSSDGIEWLAYIKYRLNSRQHLDLTYRNEKREYQTETINSTGHTKAIILNSIKQQIRLQLQWAIHKNLSTRWQFNGIRWDNGTNQNIEYGWSGFYQINWKWNNILQINFKYTLFGSDSYDSRVFLYENDVPYTLTQRQLYGNGDTFYILVRYHMNKQTRLWLKWNHIQYSDRFQIGSGNSLINSRQNNHLRFAFQFRL